MFEVRFMTSHPKFKELLKLCGNFINVKKLTDKTEENCKNLLNFFQWKADDLIQDRYKKISITCRIDSGDVYFRVDNREIFSLLYEYLKCLMPKIKHINGMQKFRSRRIKTNSGDLCLVYLFEYDISHIPLILKHFAAAYYCENRLKFDQRYGVNFEALKKAASGSLR